MRLSFVILIVGWVSACASFPDLPTSVSGIAENAPYPKLTPIDPLPDQTLETSTDAVLAARAAALRAEADRLRNHSP